MVSRSTTRDRCLRQTSLRTPAFTCRAGCKELTERRAENVTDQSGSFAPSKKEGRTLAGQAARGSGALSGFVDILMGYYANPDDLDRRRRLLAYSRYDETSCHLVMELQPDGTDSIVRQTGPEAAPGESWQGARSVLAEANSRLTRQEFFRPDPLRMDGFSQSGADWLDRYKIYPGAADGMCSTLKNQINADLLAFVGT